MVLEVGEGVGGAASVEESYCTQGEERGKRESDECTDSAKGSRGGAEEDIGSGEEKGRRNEEVAE